MNEHAMFAAIAFFICALLGFWVHSRSEDMKACAQAGGSYKDGCCTR